MNILIYMFSPYDRLTEHTKSGSTDMITPINKVFTWVLGCSE